MSVYQSDKESNRKIVAASLRNPDGSYQDDALVERSYDVKEELLRLAKNTVTRNDMLPYALEYKREIAIWKAVSLNGSWTSFITELEMGRLTVRQITILKKIVDEEFKQILEDAIADGISADYSSKVQVIEGVRSVTTSYGAHGLTARIELL